MFPLLYDAVACALCTILNKHYENKPIQIYWTFYHQKMKIFRKKNPILFHISAQNIDCGYSLEPSRRGGSNGYPQSMFLSRNKKNNVYPCKPQFYYIKVGFQGVKIIGMFSWWGGTRTCPLAAGLTVTFLPILFFLFFLPPPGWWLNIVWPTTSEPNEYTIL